MTDNIKDRLLHIIGLRAWDQLSPALDRMSNAERRLAQTLVRTDILPTLDNETFWATYLHLIIYKPQAFLACIVAIEKLAAQDRIRFDSEAARQLPARLAPAQRQKLLNMAIPVLHTVEQINGLFGLLQTDNERDRLAALIRTTSPLAYYLVLRTLLHAPQGSGLALQCYRYILRKDDTLSHNMACILQAAFALTGETGQASLRLEPYELSRIENSFEHFRYVIEGKKPTVHK